MEQASGGFASKIRGIIGIDFGTTQVSAVSVYGDGRPLSPVQIDSCLAFSDKGLTTVQIKNALAYDPKSIILNPKRHLGLMTKEEVEKEAELHMCQTELALRHGPEYKFANHTFSAKAAAAALINAVKAIDPHLNTAVVTVPHSFKFTQLHALYSSLKKHCKLDAATFVSSPSVAMAGMISSGNIPSNANHYSLVVSWTAGGMEAVVFEYKNQVLTALESSGECSMGGIDLDQRLFTYFSHVLRKKHRFNPLLDPQDQLRLRLAVSAIKTHFYYDVQSRHAKIGHLDVTFSNGKRIRESITQSVFEEICRDMVDRLRVHCTTALSCLLGTRYNIQHVILTGSCSSLIPVCSMLQELFPDQYLLICSHSNYLSGLAMRCAMLLHPSRFSIKCFDAQQIQFGIELIGNVVRRLGQPSTRLPVQLSTKLTTVFDNQPTLLVKLLTGTSSFAPKNTLVWFEDITIPERKAGEVVLEVILELHNDPQKCKLIIRGEHGGRGAVPGIRKEIPIYHSVQLAQVQYNHDGLPQYNLPTIA